jgi:hypothetical protein
MAGTFRRARLTSWGRLFFACVAAACVACPARAMNDTDAVVAMGLIPFGAGTRYLRLEAESLDVELRPSGCQVRRVYRIACRDSSGTFKLGTDVMGPDFRSNGLERALRVRVDGSSCSLTVRTGRLADRGSLVIVEPRTEEEIRDCDEHNDGDICGHTWIEFDAEFVKGRARTVSLDYGYSAKTPWHALEYGISHLALYTEKFWAGETVPTVDVRLRPVGWRAHFESFVPRGYYLKYTRREFRTDGGALRWRIHDFRPNKGVMTYQMSLVHPFSIDSKSILQAEGIGPASPPH